MKNKLIFLVLLPIFISCTNDFDESSNTDQTIDLSHYYEVRYKSNYNTVIKKTFKMRSSDAANSDYDDSSLLSLLKTMDASKLQTISEFTNPYLCELDSMKEKSYDLFFDKYSDEDYLWIKEKAKQYVELGGHNIKFIESIAVEKNQEITNILLAVFANIDNMADSSEWMELNGNTRNTRTEPNDDPYYEGYEEMEMYCRHAMRDRLILIAIDKGVEDMFEILTGNASLSMLTTCAGILDAIFVVVDYYHCINQPMPDGII